MSLDQDPEFVYPTKKHGSMVVLVLWILFFWPGAIIYAVLREWKRY